MDFKNKLKNFWRMNAQSAKGFTLVELIVVIAILAILAGIAVPAYSGYVEKANKAADEQLLANVNTAFAAACIENGTDASLVGNAYAALNEDGTVKAVYRTSASDSYNTAFAKYYSGNETFAFKVYEGLSFDSTTGMFKPITEAFANLFGAFNETDISTFNSSIFAALGFDSLMGQVDMATQVALAADPDSTLGQMIYSDANMASLATYMGYDDPASDEFAAAFESLATEKVNQMIAAGADPTDMDELYGKATNEILANTAVLVAATESDFDMASFKAQLAAGKGKDTIKSSMDNDDGNQIALSQTAMAYAMYTSYVSRNGGTATNDIFEVLDTLESDSFMSYMATNEATTDMNGYLAAMNMINTASGDSEAVSTLLVNGFNDADLIALLNQEINN